MSQNCLSPAIKTQTRLKPSAALNSNFMWITIVFFFSLFKKAGDGCDGGINQLGGNVLESHRRYWHSSKTGTVSDPAAMAFPFPLWKHILSYINPVSLFINTLCRSISSSNMSPLSPLPQCSQYLFSPIVLLGKDKKKTVLLKWWANNCWSLGVN